MDMSRASARSVVVWKEGEIDNLAWILKNVKSNFAN